MFQKIFVFLLLKGNIKAKNDNWNLWIGFLSNNGRFVTHICFSKKHAETPIFIVFWGARFLGQGVKKRKFWKPTKQEKMTDNWKDLFWVFLCFFGCFFFSCFFVFFCFCFLCFLCFFGGFKGQVRWPNGPPHLALNPPYCFNFCFCFLFFWRV